MKEVFHSYIKNADTVCILGHTSPDGDCVGSTLGARNYIKTLFPEKKVDVYLDCPSDKFDYLKGFDEIITGCEVEKSYGLCIVCDCADTKRIGKFLKYLSLAKKSFLLDHHLTNEGFCDRYVIRADASSTSEVLFDLMDASYVDKSIAECIYTGIVHDTGVFKYNCTSRHTMDIAGFCMEMGVSFGKVIDDSFYSMSFKARKLLGTVLCNMESALDGRMVYSVLDRKTMLESGIESGKEIDGYIDNIRNTEDALCAGFFHQLPDGTYKASLRSNSDKLSVAAIASRFEGGGHKMAAGCFIKGDLREGIRTIIGMVEEQLDSAE